MKLNINGIICKVSNGLCIENVTVNNSNIKYSIVNSNSDMKYVTCPIANKWKNPTVLKEAISNNLRTESVRVLTDEITIEFAHNTDPNLIRETIKSSFGPRNKFSSNGTVDV